MNENETSTVVRTKLKKTNRSNAYRKHAKHTNQKHQNLSPGEFQPKFYVFLYLSSFFLGQPGP